METFVVIVDRLEPLMELLVVVGIVVGIGIVISRMRIRPARLDGAPSVRPGVPPAVLVCFVPMLVYGVLTAIVVIHASGIVAEALSPEARPRLRINAEWPTDQAGLLRAMRSMKFAFAHHSHPVGRIFLEIDSSTGTVNLELRRDSQVPDEYWVFMPEYWSTRDEEIGRITSPLFANY